MKRSAALLCLALALGNGAVAMTADEQMRFADGIYLRGFHETAVGEYLRFLRDYPESEHVPAALYRAGESYRQMGNRAGAERFYKRVVDEHPGSAQSARAHLRRAEMALAEDRAEDALEVLDELEKLTPPADIAAAATHYRGLACQKAGDKKGAIAAFAELIELFPGSAHASYAALELATLHAGTRTSAKQIEEWFGKAVSGAATPAAKAEAMFRWGDWAYRQENYAMAADVLQSLLLELPNERRAADARLAAAWSQYYLDRPEDALALAEAAAGKAGDAETAASAIYLRANCLRKMNRDGEALVDYQAVAKQYPGTRFASRAAYETMATYFKRGEHEKALAAAPAEPEPGQAPDVAWMRAESERALGRLDLARGRYESLLKNHAKTPQAPAALLRLGEQARDAGRFDEAAELFGRVAKDYPKDAAVPEALRASAMARLRAGNPEGALADLDELLERKPDEAMAGEAKLQKALILVELGKEKDAMTALNELLEGRPGAAQLAKAQYWRGVLLADAEKWEAAETALRASLSTEPDEQTAALARLRMVVVLQRQGRMDEAASQVAPLLDNPQLVADNPALVEWAIRQRFDQEDFAGSLAAATALAKHGKEGTWRQIGWHWAGVCQAQLGNDEAASAAHGSAVGESATTREGTESQLLLAALELKAGRHESAAERFAAAAESAQGEDALDLRVRAYFGLGESAEAAGQYEAAARHYMSVAVLFDDSEWSPHALYRAGLLFGRAGKTSGQASSWKELRERYPESSFARQAALEAGASP